VTASTPRFVLPGSWGRVDLRSEAASRSSIRKLADHATHRKEELATIRAEIRERFNAAADAARGSSATDLYVAFELTKGVPMPAWLTVFTPEIDAVDFQALGITDLKGVLERGIATSAEEVTSTPTVMNQQNISAVRQSWRRVAHVEEGETVQDFDILEADYWLAATNPNRIALMTFSTAFVEYEEQMLRLFDAVVGTIRWGKSEPIVAEVPEVVAAP